jgi:integrase
MSGFKSPQPQVHSSLSDCGANSIEEIEKQKAIRGFRNMATSEPPKIQTRLERELPNLAKHELEALTHTIREFYVAKYKHSRTPKYGHLNKGFDEWQIQCFFRAIDKSKYRLLFSYMANLGFRIGEVIKINVNQIDFKTRELKLRSEKSGRLDSLIVPVQLFKETVEFIRANQDEIEKAEGYLFFSDRNGHSIRQEPYLEQNYVRKVFRDYVRMANLDEVYDTSDESNPQRKVRRLHLLTTHSLRHFAITRFARSTNGNVVLASKFARHSDPNTTLRYIHTDKHELYEAIDSISTGDIDALKKRLIK